MKRFYQLVVAFVLLALGLAGAQDTLKMQLVGKYSFPYLEGIALQGNYAYVLDNSSSPPSMTVVDVSNPANPAWVNGINLSDDLYYPNHLFPYDSHLFVGAAGAYFSIVDVSNPASPRLVGGYDEYCNDARFKDHLAYLAAGTNGLVILNIADLSHISEVGSYETTPNVLGLDVQDTLAFLACDDGSVQAVSIKDNANPFLISNLAISGYAYRIALAGHRAYVADGTKGLRILDVSDPKNMKEIGFFVSDSVTSNVKFINLQVLGSYVLVLDANFGMRMFDVSDPQNPSQVAYFKLKYPKDFWAQGDLIYAPDESGLYIIRNSLLTGIEQRTKPKTISGYYLATNYPNPFNNETVIRFRIARKERVTISLFDILGRKKKVLFNGLASAGEHRITFSAAGLAGGVYFYRMQTPHFSFVRKMILLK